MFIFENLICGLTPVELPQKHMEIDIHDLFIRYSPDVRLVRQYGMFFFINYAKKLT